MLVHLGVCWLSFLSGGAVLFSLVYIFTFLGHVWVASASGDCSAVIGSCISGFPSSQGFLWRVDGNGVHGQGLAFFVTSKAAAVNISVGFARSLKLVSAPSLLLVTIWGKCNCWGDDGLWAVGDDRRSFKMQVYVWHCWGIVVLEMYFPCQDQLWSVCPKQFILLARFFTRTDSKSPWLVLRFPDSLVKQKKLNSKKL